MSVRLARGWHLAIALLVTAAILLQLWIAIHVSATPPAHAVGTLAGTRTANRILRVLSFFTIQSNILSGVTAAQLARNPTREERSGARCAWHRCSASPSPASCTPPS
jgi:hypothetical protein